MESFEKSFWRAWRLSWNVKAGDYVDMEMMLGDAKGQSGLPRRDVEYVGGEVYRICGEECREIDKMDRRRQAHEKRMMQGYSQAMENH